MLLEEITEEEIETLEIKEVKKSFFEIMGAVVIRYGDDQGGTDEQQGGSHGGNTD